MSLIALVTDAMMVTAPNTGKKSRFFWFGLVLLVRGSLPLIPSISWAGGGIVKGFGFLQ